MIPILFTLSLGLLWVVQVETLAFLRWRRSYLASLPSWQLRMPADEQGPDLLEELYANIRK